MENNTIFKLAAGKYKFASIVLNSSLRLTITEAIMNGIDFNVTTFYCINNKKTYKSVHGL